MSYNKLTLQSVERALSVLDLLAKVNEPLTVQQIGQALDIPRTTLYATINTLEKYNFVSRRSDTKTITLGWKLYQLGLSYTRKSLNPKVIEEAQRLRSKWNLTVYAGTYGPHNRIVYILVEKPHEPYYRAPSLGFVSWAHATASGKVLMAYRPKEELLEWIYKEGALPRQTPNTITDPDTLLKELDKIRKQGYAVDNQEVLEGLGCVAVGIKNHLNEYVISMSISGPIEKILENLSAIKDDLLSTSHMLSNYVHEFMPF